MGFEGELPDEVEGVGPSFIEALYSRYLDDPSSVDGSWRRYFEGLESASRQEGPSWARTDWPLAPTDAMTAALDPTQMMVEALAAPDRSAKGASKPAAAPAPAPAGLSREDLSRAADASIRAMTLVRNYRVRGHLAANLDPLALEVCREEHPELTPEFHGFVGADQDKPVFMGGVLGLEQATIREVISILCRNYCGNIGVEYMHINDVEERRFIQEKIEGRDKEIQFTAEGKEAILRKIIEAEEFEKFLGRKYVGTKRFGLDGGESMIPALESVVKYGGQMGVNEIVIGMAHRGRLNVLTNLMEKPFQAIFHEFAGGASSPEDVGGSGDVKYHLGTSTDRTFEGNKVHLSLAPNPSHLEAVDPVVLGRARAVQTMRGDRERNTVMPVLIHGDAAFAGQGIVAECFGFSGVSGYNTGGTIHFIINNQVGFTTSPQFARSSPYPSDVAKGVQAPIFHVNGDDPEAVTFATKVATEFRQRFKRDVVIDMWCYHRFGHNEGDEPSFTQPQMYAAIKKHPPVSKVYFERLKAESQITDAWLAETTRDYIARLDADFEAAPGYRPNKADWFEGRWAGLGQPADPLTARRAADTGVSASLLREVGEELTTIPADFTIHRTLARVIERRAETIRSGQDIDWATGEALAFGTLVREDYKVRLSGQDSGRGTFSQRHAVWVDQNTGRKFVPFSNIGEGFEVHDSPLSEFGVLGFEYGYSLADPRTLVLWEAQFGDFANGAQVIIDQFIAAGEIKWLRANGLVMLLPHGYEGGGPEHSSARLERFLQLCAEDNMQVANCTTPASYFHILRRQMLRPFRKPLVIMTPKSLLRHKRAVSTIEDFGPDSRFRRVLPDQGVNPAAVTRVVMCSGKVYYDLLEAREEAGLRNVAILRLEQLYPYPGDAVERELTAIPGVETVVWAQEEPKNQGSWRFIDPLIEETLAVLDRTPRRAIYVGRAPAAATATGIASRHAAEQARLVRDALGI